jgi:hypothetical protein
MLLPIFATLSQRKSCTDMSRRAASISQADIARAIRAARQAGADAVEVVQSNGTTIRVILKAPPTAPEPQDEFEKWNRENESAKAARRRDRV